MIVFLGDVGIDWYPATGEERSGGCALNAARAALAARVNDEEIVVVAPLGDDERGRRLAERIEPELARGLVFLPGATPCQKIELRVDGERVLCGYDAGVLADWRPNAMQRALVAAADVVHTVAFTQIRALFEGVLALPRRGRLLVDFMDSSDFGPDDYWSRIDGAFFGLTPERELSVFQRPDKTVVVTLGAAGSVCFEGGRTHRCAADPVARVVDTTGAGDTYAGTFLARRSEGLDAAMRAASRAAARRIGAE